MEKCIQPMRRVLAANANSSAFTAKVPTTTKPVNDGVIDLAGEGGLVTSEFVKIWAVGVGADNDAFSVRLTGWSKLKGTTSTTRDLWVPSVLGELGCVLSARVGVAGTLVPATERFSDTFTIVTEGTITQLTTREGTIVTYSPAADIIGFALVPVVGFDLLEFDFDQTTNTPTMNVLVSLY